MRKALVIGNWKMNGALKANEALLQAISSGRDDTALAAVDIAVCPPFVYLAQVHSLLAGSKVGLGAQNVCADTAGAFTGEVSAGMLREFACRWVIIGHSERRSLYGEADAEVSRKVERVLSEGMTPVVCVGETLEEREAGQALQRVCEQLDAAIKMLSNQQAAEIVVAYEPVWAIGTGLTASPEQAQEVHRKLREQLRERSLELGEKVRILYGGSVNSANADALFAQPDIDGGLIGGASLKAEDFLAICRAAAGAS